ncbi:unnamed protein product [Meloidogyne enterolobii]|uniref:Uncharacterized protein n=1 Tax=Meloidogyne enterolobii TaxID=390850 RepID=A0ACB1ANG0_MELEN
MDKAYRETGLALTVDGLGAGMRCLVVGDGLGMETGGGRKWSSDLFLTFCLLKDKISEDDKKKVLDKCQETLSWLYANQTAEKEEFEHHQKELEAICNTINSKPYCFNIKQPMDDKV